MPEWLSSTRYGVRKLCGFVSQTSAILFCRLIICSVDRLYCELYILMKKKKRKKTVNGGPGVLFDITRMKTDISHQTDI